MSTAPPPDDSRDLFDGLRQVLAGADQVRRAAPSVLGAIDQVVEQLVDPATVQRVAAAGLGAVAQALGDEARAAAARPHPAAPNHLPCRRHGEQPYEGTLVCTAEGCGRVYQVRDAGGAHFAPAICPCGVQLLPGPGAQHSGKGICSVCAKNIWAKGERAVRRTT